MLCVWGIPAFIQPESSGPELNPHLADMAPCAEAQIPCGLLRGRLHGACWLMAIGSQWKSPNASCGGGLSGLVMLVSCSIEVSC